MIWAGSPFAHRVEFSTGAPASAVSYRVLGNDGTTVLDEGTASFEHGAVDLLIVVPALHNTCDKPLFEMRTITWSYLTSNGAQSGRMTYHVNRPLPFAVSADGVRTKLGLSAHEIDDKAIDLVLGYSEFAELVGAEVLALAAAAGDRSTLLALNAIEATAALYLLPTVQLRAAQSETSGTNQFARFGTIDWSFVEVDLLGQVAKARLALDPSYDAIGTAAFTFGTAPRETDAFTGEAN